MHLVTPAARGWREGRNCVPATYCVCAHRTVLHERKACLYRLDHEFPDFWGPVVFAETQPSSTYS